MMLSAILNDTDKKMLWAEAVHMCERVMKSRATTVITTILFGNLYGEKTNIIGSFSEFRRIGYVTKQDKFKKQMKYKTFKAIMVGYFDNNTRDT